MLRHETWTWRFDSPAEAVWSVLADTARTNEASGLPKYVVEETPRADGSVAYVGRVRRRLLNIAWDDIPGNWVEARWFHHERRFHGGPLCSLTSALRLFPEDGGSRGEYTLTVETANMVGDALLGMGFFAAQRRRFFRLAAGAEAFVAGRRKRAFDMPPPKLPDGARKRALEAARRIDAGPYGHDHAFRLAEHVLTAQEVDLWTIRPLRLARLWGLTDRQAAELCIDAVRHGLLRLRWDLLCPRCQNGKDTVPSLDYLPQGAHCAACNIDYGRDYAKNVELAFRPADAIRPIEHGYYCLYGPKSTPHVKVQITLGAGERRAEPVVLPRGVFRIRTLEPGGESAVDWTGEGCFPAVVVEGDTVRPMKPEADMAAPGMLVLENRLDRPRTVVLEERAWTRDALTAHRATTLQVFRDLLHEQVLRPGDDVEIDGVTMMFTDLKGSTALYHRIGDTEAYVLVREHYAIIGAAVRASDGAVVKTIGDAVMAAFHNPLDAFRCAVRIQDDFAAYNAAAPKEAVVVKLGIHTGRCISVTLNNRLDYYGSTANMASRLQQRSHGGDIVVSATAAADPALAPLLADYVLAAEQTSLKGFPAPIPYYRVTADALAARRAAPATDIQEPVLDNGVAAVLLIPETGVAGEVMRTSVKR